MNLNTVCKEKQYFALVESCEKKTLEKIPEGIFILFMAISENLGLKTVIMAIMFLLADDQLCVIMKKLWNKQMLVGTSGKNNFQEICSTLPTHRYRKNDGISNENNLFWKSP